MVDFKDFSRLLSDSPVLIKTYLTFKDFSRKPSKFKYFSSLCDPCHNSDMEIQNYLNLTVSISKTGILK